MTDTTNHIGENQHNGIKLTIRVNQTNHPTCDKVEDDTLPDKNNNVDTLPSDNYIRMPASKYSSNTNSDCIIQKQLNSAEGSKTNCLKSEQFIYLNNQTYPPVNGSLPETNLPESIASTSIESIQPVHKYKKKKKKKKSKHKLSDNIEKKLSQAKRLRLIFGNDSISIDIKNKLKL